MTWAVVFKGLEVHRIYEQGACDWPGTMFLMNQGFSYVVFGDGDWYCLTSDKGDMGIKVKKENVPPELRAIALLLEIPS